MKTTISKLVLCGIFAAVCGSAFPQVKVDSLRQYIHCLDDGEVKWSILYEIIDLGTETCELLAKDDTLINGVLYKNVYYENYVDFEPTNMNRMGVLNCFANQTHFYHNEDLVYPYNTHLEQQLPLPCGYRELGGHINSTDDSPNYQIKQNEHSIEIKFLTQDKYEVCLHDIYGRLCYYYKRNINDVVIPINHLATGVYLLKIYNKNCNQIHINKIIL